MSINISLKDSNRGDHARQIDRRPDVCPLCHHAIELTEYHYAYFNTATNQAQLVHRCPRVKCQGLFFANYGLSTSTGRLHFSNVSPTTNVPRTFSDIVSKTSKEFCDIYDQARASESQGHLNV